MTKLTDTNDDLLDVEEVEKEAETKPTTIDPEMLAMLKSQIMDELKSEKEMIRQEVIEQREKAKKAQDEYVAQMKQSSDPWVDIQGWVTTEQGVRVELDWNDAFVAHLKSEGIKGADDDQVVQHWVTLLLRDMTTQLEEEAPEQSEYE